MEIKKITPSKEFIVILIIVIAFFAGAFIGKSL